MVAVEIPWTVDHLLATAMIVVALVELIRSMLGGADQKRTPQPATSEGGEGRGGLGAGVGSGGGETTRELPVSSSSSSIFGSSRKVVIDVGGVKFLTTMSTLCRFDEDNYFCACLRFARQNNSSSNSNSNSNNNSNDDDDDDDYNNKNEAPFAGGMGGNAPLSIFVDRDATHFRHVLNFLRDGICPHLTPTTDQTFVRELLVEARFYQVVGLVAELEEHLEMQENIRREEEKHGLSSEKEYKMVHVRKIQDIETTFRSWIQRGYELVHMSQLVRQGIVAGTHSPSRSFRHERNEALFASPQQAPSFADDGGGAGVGGDFHVIMTFSKNLTKADMSFIDRLMAGS